MRKVLASVVLLALAGCGGSSTSPTPVVPTPPPVPSAAITATGSGSLVLHPSAVRAFAVALETPIRRRCARLHRRGRLAAGRHGRASSSTCCERS